VGSGFVAVFVQADYVEVVGIVSARIAGEDDLAARGVPGGKEVIQVESLIFRERERGEGVPFLVGRRKEGCQTPVT
jgi:hypothetical protein